MYDVKVNPDMITARCNDVIIYDGLGVKIGTFTGTVIYDSKLDKPPVFVGVSSFYEEQTAETAKQEALKILTGYRDKSIIFGVGIGEQGTDGCVRCGQCGNFELSIEDGWCQCFNRPTNMHTNCGRGCIGFFDRKKKW